MVGVAGIPSQAASGESRRMSSGQRFGWRSRAQNIPRGSQAARFSAAQPSAVFREADRAAPRGQIPSPHDSRNSTDQKFV
jgi:hypothetical protein